MPLLDTPERLQDRPHGCGATAFEILFRFHFPRRPMPEWGELADPVRGIGPDTLELFVRKEFANSFIGQIDLRTLRHLTGFTPVLCILTVGPESDHWVCVRGVTGKHVYTQDPDCGRRKYTHAEWMTAWRDATAGGVYERFAVTGW
jgi:hypothetical protein